MSNQTSLPLHISCGAVIYKKNEAGEVNILLLHRNKSKDWDYDSWHLPKGTQDSGESYEQTAKREIFEETGYKIALEDKLGELFSTYERDGSTREKKTIYFIAQAIERANDLVTEHDEIKWVPLEKAIELVSAFPIYEKEEEILEKFKTNLSTR